VIKYVTLNLRASGKIAKKLKRVRFMVA